MDSTEIKEAYEYEDFIEHEKGDTYKLTHTTPVKIDGEWVTYMFYKSMTSNETYGRDLDNFKKFKLA